MFKSTLPLLLFSSIVNDFCDGDTGVDLIPPFFPAAIFGGGVHAFGFFEICLCCCFVCSIMICRAIVRVVYFTGMDFVCMRVRVVEQNKIVKLSWEREVCIRRGCVMMKRAKGEESCCLMLLGFYVLWWVMTCLQISNFMQMKEPMAWHLCGKHFISIDSIGSCNSWVESIVRRGYITACIQMYDIVYCQHVDPPSVSLQWCVVFKFLNMNTPHQRNNNSDSRSMWWHFQLLI